MFHPSHSETSHRSGVVDSSSTTHPGQPVHSGIDHDSLFVQHYCPWCIRYYLSVSKYNPPLFVIELMVMEAVLCVGFMEKNTVINWNRCLSLCRFVCCVMVAIPLGATLFTAIIRLQRNREVSPKSSCLHSDLSLYGTMRTSGSSSSDSNTFTLEENGKSEDYFFILGVPHDDASWVWSSWRSVIYRIFFFLDSTSHSLSCFPRSCVYQFLQVFSLQTTSQGVLSTSSTITGGGYSCLNGIRVLSLFWIMSGHAVELTLFGLGTWKHSLVAPLV